MSVLHRGVLLGPFLAAATLAGGAVADESAPVPDPVIIVGKDGKIAYQYVNPDYRVRPSADLVMAAVRDCAERAGARAAD
jgi:hypothetical protein